MMRSFRWFAALVLMFALAIAAPASAYEPNDPFHTTTFLNLLRKVLVVARSGDRIALKKAMQELDDDVKRCGELSDRDLAERVKKMAGAQRHPALAAYIRLFDAILRMPHGYSSGQRNSAENLGFSEAEISAMSSEKLPIARYLEEVNKFGDIAELDMLFGTKKFQQLFGEGVFIQAYQIIYDKKNWAKFTGNDPYALTESERYALASYYFVRKNTAKFNDAVSAMRDDRRKLDFLLLKNDSEHRKEMCAKFIDKSSCASKDYIREKSGYCVGNWKLLLCGQFEDAMSTYWKAREKANWSECGLANDALALVELANAVQATALLAAETRHSQDKADSADQLLEQAVADAERLSYISSHDHNALVNITIESDIDVFMKTLFGLKPDLNVVKGVLEKSRGRPDAARDAWREALSGTPPLSQSWKARVNDWIKETR